MNQRYHHGALAEALLDAALALIEEGHGAPSLREVARRAGVSAMAPYRHFEDHAALLGAVAARGFERLTAALIEADAVPSPAEALVAQGRAYINFALAHPLLFRLMFAGGGVAAAKPDDGGYSVLARRAAQIAPDASAATALACWSMVHGLATLAIDQRLGRVDLDAMEVALRLLVDGLAARIPAAPGRGKTG